MVGLSVVWCLKQIQEEGWFVCSVVSETQIEEDGWFVCSVVSETQIQEEGWFVCSVVSETQIQGRVGLSVVWCLKHRYRGGLVCL